MKNGDARHRRRRSLRLPGGGSTHGLASVGTLIRVASRARIDAFDRRTAAGRLVHDAKEEFTAHLGGSEEASFTQCALIGRLAMRTLVIALVDEMLLGNSAGNKG
jgi:hypothetical protein